MDFRKVRLLIRLGRLHFLIPGVLLYTLGALLAIENGFTFNPGLFLFGYAIFFFGHLSVHFSNDYFDREADRAAQRTPVSGGSGVLVDQPELANLALMIAILLLGASMVTAIAFTVFYSFSLWFLLFAVLGGLLGWFYTAPPLKLVHRGLGEASTALAIGFIMPGMGYYVMSGRIDLWFVVLSLPLICYGLYFIVTVEMPDIDSDRASGRVNLLVNFGLRNGTRVALLALGLATISLSIIAFTNVLGRTMEFWYLALFSLIPLAIAGYGATRNLQQRKQIISQVKLNFVAMMSFLLFFIAVSGMAILS